MSRKEELIDAAIKLFAANGYHPTKVSDIVNEAGVAQGTFYLYFKTKKAILLSILEHFYSLIWQAVSEVRVDFTQLTGPVDLAVRIRIAVESIIGVYREYPDLSRVCLRQAANPDPEVVALWRSMTSALVEFGTAILDEAIKHDLLPPQNTKIVAQCVIGMHEHVAYAWLANESKVNFDELVDALTRFEMLGISGTPTPEMKKAIEGKY